MDFWNGRPHSQQPRRSPQAVFARLGHTALLLAVMLALAAPARVAAQEEPPPPTESPAPQVEEPPAQPAPLAQSPEAGPQASPAARTTATAARTTPATPPPSPPAQAAAPVTGDLVTAPQQLDLDAWLTFKRQARITNLPDQARLFYRRGATAWRSGQKGDALRLMRGASELDPGFVLPHLTLAAWFLLREPSQALFQYAAVLELWRQHFLLQLELVANTYFLVYHALFFGVLAAAWMMIWVHQSQLRHTWQERLGRHLTRETSRAWPWALLALPLLMGFGAALPAVFLLGLLWFNLRARERSLYVLLVAMVAAAPWAGALMGRFAEPLREDAAPFYGVASLERQPYSPEQMERLARLAREHPGNPFVQFGLGWSARRGGDLSTAETAYRQVLRSWDRDDRVHNDLGNVLAMQGRLDDALRSYRRAVELNPENAAALFNMSQVHTRRFDYQSASDAVAKASALNFELVKAYQSESQRDGSLPLADQWVAPATFWKALFAPGTGWTFGSTLPPSWMPRFEAFGWPMGVATLLVACLGILMGWTWNRALPLRTCSNCARVVCRRCSVRQRETALCPSCATVAARAENADFGRILLNQQRRRIERRDRMTQTALATLLPCYGLLALRRVFGPLFLLMVASAAAVAHFGNGTPLWYEPRLNFPDQTGSGLGLLVIAVFVYVASLFAYFRRLSRERSGGPAPIRSRLAQITHLTAKAA